MKYCFVVSACSKYVPELCALLNSFDLIGNKHDVKLIGYQLPASFTSQFSKLGFQVDLYDVPEAEARLYGGESEIVCRKRYWYAAEWGQAYDAVCVLDADMVMVRDVDQYFEIAARCGFIVGASLEQKRVYGHIDHHKVRGQQLIEPTWNPRDICCAPMFVDMKVYGDLFRECWQIFADGFPETNFKAPDMESFNLLILHRKLTDKVLLVSNPQFVGTNEKLLKPYLRAIGQSHDPAPGGKLWTETGDPIYVLHGQFYKKKWRKQQLLNRKGCADTYLGGSANCDRMSAGALEGLHEYFKKCLDYKIQVEKKAYTTDGHPDFTMAERGEVLI